MGSNGRIGRKRMQYGIDLRVKVLRLSFSIGPDQVQPDPKNSSTGPTKGSTGRGQNRRNSGF